MNMLHQLGLGIRDYENCGFFVGFDPRMTEDAWLTSMNKYFSNQRTVNGLAGTKLSHDYFNELGKLIKWGTSSDLSNQFTNTIDYHVLLARRDKSAQAVSLYIAHYTKAWSCYKPDVPIYDVPFNVGKIAHLEAFCAALHVQNKKFLDLLDKKYVTIYYEDLYTRPRKELSYMLARWGIVDSGISEIPEPQIFKQSTELNERLIEKYNEYTR